jgi:hypothetical protein
MCNQPRPRVGREPRHGVDPASTLRSGQQHQVAAEQVDRRQPLAGSFEPDIRRPAAGRADGRYCVTGSLIAGGGVPSGMTAVDWHDWPKIGGRPILLTSCVTTA